MINQYLIYTSLGLVLISKQLVVVILTVIFSLTSRLVLILSQEGLLLMDESVESLERVPWVLLKFNLKELAFFSQYVFDCVDVHSHSSKQSPCLSACQMVHKVVSSLVK